MPDDVEQTPDDQQEQAAETPADGEAKPAAAAERPAARERPARAAAEEKAPARVAGPGGVVAAGADGRQVVIARAPVAEGTLPKVSRRGLMKIGFWSGLGALLVAFSAATLNLLYPRGISGFGNVLFVGTVDQLQPGQRLRNIEARAWVVRFNADQARRNNAEEGAILALWQRCPHLGCVVPYNATFSFLDPRNQERYPGWFRCPCHGSTYSDAGVRVFGPAPRSMDTFEVTIDNGNILVNTGAITQGAEDNGQRAILPGQA